MLGIVLSSITLCIIYFWIDGDDGDSDDGRIRSPQNATGEIKLEEGTKEKREETVTARHDRRRRRRVGSLRPSHPRPPPLRSRPPQGKESSPPDPTSHDEGISRHSAFENKGRRGRRKERRKRPRGDQMDQTDFFLLLELASSPLH